MAGSIWLRPFRRLRAAINRRLIPNWLRVAKRSYSFKLGVIAAFFGGLEVFWPLLPTVFEVPPRLFAVISFAVGMVAPISRLIHQSSISGDKNDGR